MKRQIISIIALVMALCGHAQITQEGLTFSLLSDNTLQLDSCAVIEGIVNVPAHVTDEGKTYTVTAIGPRVFANLQLAAISLPETVTAIGEGAFWNCTATFVRMSPNVATVGAGAFSGCRNIGHIDLPASLTTLNTDALYDTSLYTIGTKELPNLTYVGDWAFGGSNNKLQTFPLTDKVEYLGEGAFSGCSCLKSITLPSQLTEIPDNLFSGCTSLQTLALPEGIVSIGAGAFNGSGIRNLDFSKYLGRIGPLAFNNCAGITVFNLSADNPYCYASNQGQVLHDRATREPLTILPSATELVFTYPITGHVSKGDTIFDYYGNPTLDYYNPFAGNFSNLTKVELGHTWVGSVNASMPALEQMTVRAPQPFKVSGSINNETTIHVFPYARDAFQKSYDIWSNFPNYADIDLPIEKLYMAEVLPMYEGLKVIRDGHGTVWASDWNSELAEYFPQYFADTISNDIVDYRSFLLSQYMTDEKLDVYGYQPDSTLQCLDGSIRISSAFDVNDYVNWYMSGDTITADKRYNTSSSSNKSTTVAPTEDGYWLFSGSTESTSVSVEYALPMVPEVPYRIKLLVAPHHPQQVQVGEEWMEPKNSITPTLLIYGTKQQRLAKMDIIYTGELQAVVLADSVYATCDFKNSIQITSSTSASQRKRGYINALCLMGVVAEPLTDFETLPTGVEGPDAVENARIVGYYDLSGRRLSRPVRGINLVRYSDGSTRRVLMSTR